MKRILLLLLLLALPLSVARAQSVPTLESLEISFWPDYDEASVLVLLTGSLPAAAPLPAAVTLPLSPGARLHAVARIDNAGVMIDDIAHTAGPGEITLTTPDRRFRVEFYVPYLAENNQRTFTYTWQADIAVNQLIAVVQQPAAATNLTTEPAAATVTRGNDGLTYHTLPAQAVPAAQLYTVRAGYTMLRSQLTAAGSPESAAPAIVEPAPAFNWPLALLSVAAALAIVALAWRTATRRPATRARKPRPRSKPSSPVSHTPAAPSRPPSAQVHFCHHCGHPAQSPDRFCRACGTPLKGR